MLTARDVAERLGLSLSKVYDLANSGKLVSYRFDGAMRFELSDVEAFKAASRVVPPVTNTSRVLAARAAVPNGENELDRYFRSHGLQPRGQRRRIHPSSAQTQSLKQYPAGALLRVREICGDRKAGLPGLLPIASRTWLKWVEEGRVPQGMLLGPRTRVWKIEQVLAVRDAIAPVQPTAAGQLPASE